MLKVGLVGLGHMGQLNLLNTLRIDGIAVVAGADKSEKNRKFAERYHVKTYSDYTELFETEELDAAVISLPNFLKEECVFYAAERGVNIFLDKPIARNLSEAQAMVNKVEKENVRMLVGANYRYFPCVQKLKRRVDNGEIGDPLIATSELILNGPISHALVPHPIPEWWLNKDLAGGGALLDLGYHLIDLLTWLVGDFDVAYASLESKLHLPIEDAGTVVLKGTNCDATGIVNVGWFSKTIFPEFNFRVNMHGTVGYDSTDHYIPANAKVSAVKEGVANVLRRMAGKKPNYLSYTYYYSSFYQILNEFFAALKSGTEFPVSLDEELRVMRIIDSAYRLSELPSENQMEIPQIVV